MREPAAADRDDKVSAASGDLPPAIRQLGLKVTEEKCSLNGVGAVRLHKSIYTTASISWQKGKRND